MKAARFALLLLLLPSFGFDWPGQVYRLEHELAHAEPAQRRDLVRRLAQFPAAEVKEPVLRELEDDDAGARLEAAAVAGRVRLREAVPILLDWLDDKEADTRQAAASALGHIGEARALPALTRALGDSDADVRREAVLALGRIGGLESVPPLLGRFEDVDLRVRIDAIGAVSGLRDARAVVPLLGQAGDPAAEVRIAALRALGQLGDARALPALTRALGDEVDEVRLAAAGALGQIGDRSAVRSLRASLERDDVRLGQAVIAALAAIDDGEAREVLIAQLAHPALRRAAILGIVQQAARLARTPAPAVPAAAATDAGITPAATAAAVPPIDTFVLALAAMLRATEPGAAAAAAEALTRVAEVAPIRAAQDALLAALNGADPSAAPALMLALAASGSPDALMPLLERLEQTQGDALTPVLDALALHFARGEADGRAADPLLGRLQAVSGAQRVAIVELLGRVGAPRALPAITPLLESADPALRLATVRAIGAIGATEGGPALLRLIDSDDARTRFEVARSLRATADAATLHAVLARIAGDGAADRHALLIALGGGLARLQRAKQVPEPLAADALQTLAGIIAGDDVELADRALDALSVWAPPQALAVAAQSLRAPSARRRAAAVQALAQLDDPGARELLRFVLLRSTPREATVAAAGLGERGDQRDLAALVKATKRLHWPVPGAAAYALFRMSERGMLKPHSAMRALCELGRSREPYVRANVAAAMAVLGGGSCDGDQGGPDPIAWLGAEHAAVVRAAAARWLHVALAQGHVEAEAASAALERCAAADVEPAVRDACATAPARTSFEPTDVYAYARDGVTLLREMAVALKLENGAVYVGYTDRNGHLRLPAAPRGVVQMEDPGLVPLEPAN